ncbi:MAG TPA: FecR domain-containing protein, partial [Gemmatimonadaceae bacterium]
DRGAGADRAASPMALATAAGARDSVRLPDGTRVLLGPASRLTWDARDARVVTLEGMAHFAVVHDAAQPFTVRAGDAVVRDVGTTFVVRTDAGASPRVVVAVSEGAVSLAVRGEQDPFDAHRAVTLAAGDRGELVGGSTTVVQRAALAASDTAWTSGRLVYTGTPLDRVVADVARWYGVELRIADRALLARRLTASFDASDPPARVVDAIALTLGARVTREAGGRIAMLHPGPTP